jgi:ferric-dicitrate binding protein FerR (iron transport regulator)
MNTDLHILALHYALGELAGADALAFENRLETDQSAREALADAVILSSAVRQLPRPTRNATPKPADRRSRIAAIIAGCAACLLVVALIKLPQGDRPVARHRTGIEATAIVGTWSELGDENLAVFDSDSDLIRDDASSDVPDWMVAAVLEDAEQPASRQEGTL